MRRAVVQSLYPVLSIGISAAIPLSNSCTCVQHAHFRVGTYACQSCSKDPQYPRYNQANWVIQQHLPLEFEDQHSL